MCDTITIVGRGYIGLPTATLFSSPVGTTQQMADWLAEIRPYLSFSHQAKGTSDICISYCPERVLPGRIIHELVANDRVIGGMTTVCTEAAVGPWFLVDSASQQARLIRTAREVNDTKSNLVIHKVEKAIDELGKNGLAAENQEIACFGFTFKPDINDLRESPALKITQALVKRYEGKVDVVDPNLQALPEALSDAEVILMDSDEAITRANILVLLVDHAQFK